MQCVPPKEGMMSINYILDKENNHRTEQNRTERERERVRATEAV